MKSLVYICLSVFFLGFAWAKLDSNTTVLKKYFDKNGLSQILKNGQVVLNPAPPNEPGWTIIQRRVDASTSFYRNWATYKEGFGELERNFFIGLNRLHTLTASKPHELYIHMEDFEGNTRYAKYDRFEIGNEANLYGLNVLGSYSGTAGDSLGQHRNRKFSTYDRNNGNQSRNCAAEFTGAWWYNECHFSNLNGLYLDGSYEGDQNGRGINWYNWRGHYYSLKFVQMMVRPK